MKAVQQALENKTLIASKSAAKASSGSKAGKASSSEHSGQWRDHDVTSLCCSIPGGVEGPLCAHGSGIIVTSHWSCCGARKRDASCNPGGGDSDGDSSSSSEGIDLDSVFGSGLIRCMMKNPAEADSKGNHFGHVWYGCTVAKWCMPTRQVTLFQRIPSWMS